MFIKIIFLNKIFYFISLYLALYLRAARDHNIRLLYIIIIIYCIFNLYIKNDVKLDILTYIDVINKNYYDIAFDPGFALIIDIMRIFFSDGADIIFSVQIFLSCCFLLVFGVIIQNYSSANSLDRLLFSIISVAFILGINNNLRQCFSALLIILALDIMILKRSIRNDTIKFIVFTVLATMLHRSAVAFCLYTYAFLLLDRLLPNSIILRSILILLGNIFIAISLYDILQYTRYTAYEGLVLAGGGRTNVLVKLSAYLFLISFLTIFFRKSFFDEKLRTINYLRFSFAVLSMLIFVITGAGELASRLLYFCFVLDLYIICLLLINKRLTAAVVSGSTGVFALNSVNILVF